MKRIRPFILIYCILITSCITQKQIVSQNELSVKSNIQEKENKYKFDLLFLDTAKVQKAFIDSNEIIHFTDSILEKRIKMSLNLDSSFQINTSIADTVKELILNTNRSDKFSGQIKSLDGLQYFQNLERLYFSFNAVSDLSPLANLHKLERITAQNNQIENIDPIKDLTKLKYLTLYRNNVSDVSALSNLTNLVYVCFWDNRLVNIEIFSKLVNLQDVNLGRNLIKDISPLSNCKKLHTIWIPYNPITNPEILSAFNETLKVLSIAGCNIKNIDYLEDCVKMRDLLIFNNQISDISVIHKMTNLRSLLASNNQITNIDVIPHLINKGAFKDESRFGKLGINIDLKCNPINLTLEKNKQIKAYIEDNVKVIEL